MRSVKRYGDHILCTVLQRRQLPPASCGCRWCAHSEGYVHYREVCRPCCSAKPCSELTPAGSCLQGKLFKGAALFAPMLSLERASQHGLNYYLRSQLSVLNAAASDLQCHVLCDRQWPVPGGELSVHCSGVMYDMLGAPAGPWQHCSATSGQPCRQPPQQRTTSIQSSRHSGMKVRCCPVSPQAWRIG